MLAKQAEKGRQQANFPPNQSQANGDIENILRQASQAELARQNQVAEGLYQQVVQIDPRNSQAHHRLGVLADQAGRYAEAQNHYQIALSQEPNNALLLSDIGYSLYSQDRLDEAEQYLQASLKIQPNNQFARNNLAQVYQQRAVQSGSQSDYQLAQDQIALANASEVSMEQSRSGTDATLAASESRKGFPNPFKLRSGRDAAQQAPAGENLQAPDPNMNKATQKFIADFEKLKKEAIKRGEYRSSRGGANAPGQRPPLNQNNVPTHQLNDELSKIDNEARLRRELAIRELSPDARRPRGNPGPDQRSQPNDIELAGGQYDSIGSGGPRINPQRHRRPTAAASPQEFDSPQSDMQGQIGPTGQYDRQPVMDRWENNGQVNDPSQDQTWQLQDSPRSRSWPERPGTPTQNDASGEVWDGHSLMPQDRVAPGTGRSGGGVESNPQDYTGPGSPNYRIETSNQGGGNRQGQYQQEDQGHGIQAPKGWGSRDNGTPSLGTPFQRGFSNQDPNSGQYGARQTAAELSLGAGAGEMFPGNGMEQSGSGNRRQGRPTFGSRNDFSNQPNVTRSDNGGGSWPAVDPHNQTLRGPASTPNGMPQGGAGMMAPTEYAPRQAGFETYRSSQSGDDYGNAGHGTQWSNSGGPGGNPPRNTVRPRRPVYTDPSLNFGDNAATYRDGSRSSQDLGAPSMNFDR